MDWGTNSDGRDRGKFHWLEKKFTRDVRLDPSKSSRRQGTEGRGRRRCRTESLRRRAE
jgi:hypothetical protein